MKPHIGTHILVLLQLALAATGTVLAEETPDLSRSVCRVSVSNGFGGNRTYGSGVVIDAASIGMEDCRDLFVLTCEHVVDDARKARCDFWNDASKSSCEAEVVQRADRVTGKDLALLRIPHDRLQGGLVHAVPIPEQWRYDKGQKVFVGGCPRAGERRIDPGALCRESNLRLGRSDQERDVLFHPQSKPGHSGGGLFSSDGRLIGVVHSRNGGHGIAVTIDAIRTFLGSDQAIEEPGVPERPEKELPLVGDSDVKPNQPDEPKRLISRILQRFILRR